MTTRPFDVLLRDHETLNVPSSGAHEPIKPDMRDTLNALFGKLTGVNSGATIHDSFAIMDALDLADDVMSWVVGDANPALDGVYGWASGTPTRRGDLPYGIIQLNNSGAGTADAIQATTAIGVPDAAFGAILVLNIVASNTIEAVTVAINGDAPLPLVTNTGGAVPVDYLTPGMGILCVNDGTNLRMLSYGDAAAIQTAVEILKTEIEAAIAAAEIYWGGDVFS